MSITFGEANRRKLVFVNRIGMWAAGMLCALLISGCQMLPVRVVGASGATTHELISYASELARAEPDALSRYLDTAQRQWKADPGPLTRARLGLVRGQWGYSGFSPRVAADELQAALKANPAPWDDNGRAFLTQRMLLLRYFVSSEGRSRSSATRIKQLEQELADTREKLQAISEIEENL